MITRLLLFLCLGSLVACGQSSSTDPAPAAAPSFANVSPEEFQKLMDDPDVVILDVRTPGETAAGTIEGAVEMDYRDPSFSTKVAELDKDKTYLVYCAVGGRSGGACAMLSEAGFGKVYNLAGGYTAWKDQ